MASITKEPYIPIAKRLQDVEEYYFSSKLQEVRRLIQDGHDIINMGIGSPDLPPAPSVVEKLCEHARLPDAHGYQNYKGIVELRQAFARWYSHHYRVELDASKELLPLMGSKEGIMHISMTYLDAGDQVLVPDPGYAAYSTATRVAGGVPLFYHLEEKNGWQVDIKSLEVMDTENIKLMWVNYPHMPTGAVATSSHFEELVRFGMEHNILICHDTPYGFTLNSEKPMSMLAIPEAKSIVIELNSLSKSHNMAGWRVGVMASAEQHINDVMKFKTNMDSGMFLPVQQAAVQALSLDAGWYKSNNEIYAQRKKHVLAILDHLGCTYKDNQVGLFVWARIPSSYKDGYEMADKFLYNKNILITPGGVFGSQGSPYIRVSLCLPTSRIKEALNRF